VLSQFCLTSGEFAEIYLTANIPAQNADAFVKAIRLQVDGVTVAIDSKSIGPVAAPEDRSFALFYKTVVGGISTQTFEIQAVYDLNSPSGIGVEANALAYGYRTYASGYPVAATAASCS